MPAPTAEDPRLTRITQLCLALPDAARATHGSHADFRVRSRVFATTDRDHDDDGIVSVCCKSELGENVDRAKSFPARFYLPAYIGARGWFGLRLDTGPIDWDEVENILTLSYCLVAPRKLAQTVTVTPRAR